jgi:RimJ/RimL family protein N-acetyltransferase
VTRRNDWDQPVGDAVAWHPRDPLVPTVLAGRWVSLEPLGPEHGSDLHDATCGADREPAWTYLPDEMPSSREEFARYVDARLANPGLASLAIVPAGGRAAGLASWMRDDPANGVVEVGSILLGPALQRTTAATEAMWLMAAHAFERGYRRYEWKCDALNAPSRAAALRLGFTYEGTFRRAVVYKGRNRDTAWFSVTDQEWRRLAPAYESWLAPDNFEDPDTGRGQRTSLSRLTAAALGPR